MSLKISSVGDIMLGENMHHYGRGVASRYDGRYPELVAPLVREEINCSDILFGNFECSLMPDAEWQGAPLERAIYAAPESALNFFCGWKPFVVLNVANNHFGQHGAMAAEYTCSCLEKRGIHCVGQSPSPLVLEVSGVIVVAWGVTIVKDQCVGDGYFKSTAETLLADMQWIDKMPGAIWVVSIHWGNEYLTLPSEEQQKLAALLKERGVDLIFGHHPHVVQPVQKIGETWVAFSHGNFIFDQNFSMLTQRGLLMNVEVGSPECQLRLVRIKKYRAISSKPIVLTKLKAYCRRRFGRLVPLRMRVLMKLELVFHFWEVSMPVWRCLGHRLLRKVF